MKFEITSTGSPQDVARRFAREAFKTRREVDVRSLKEETPAKTNGSVRALFKLTDDAHQWYELEGVPPGHWTITSKHRPPRKVIAIPLDQVYHEATRDQYDKRARLLVAGVNDFPGFSLGIIRKGEEGRQVYQGPMVPGPWAFASGHATVIDNHGGTGSKIDQERAAGLVYEAECGDLLEIDGCHFLIGPDHNRNVRLTLVPAPE